MVCVFVGYLEAFRELVEVGWLDIHLPSETEYAHISGI